MRAAAASAGGRLLGELVLAVCLLLAADSLAFRTAAYHGVLDPVSSTGSFEAMLARERARPVAAQRDVLVVGDSRIVEALSDVRATRSAHGLRAINAAIPGTTPRCWFYFLRDVDPQARRYRAIVIPFDTYDDVNSAIGAPDAADHIADLHYVLYRLRPGDWIAFAMSMQWNRGAAFMGEILRGLVLKSDAQAFLEDPARRYAALQNPLAAFPPPNYAGRSDTLRGLRMDARGRLVFPPGVTPEVRAEVAHRIFDPPSYNAAYGAYRKQWIGAILQRYAASPTMVVFVRVPAMPIVLHRQREDPHSSVRELARRYGAAMLSEREFADLERPRYFSDHAHLDAGGRAIFSDRFGADLARVLQR